MCLHNAWVVGLRLSGVFGDSGMVLVTMRGLRVMMNGECVLYDDVCVLWAVRATCVGVLGVVPIVAALCWDVMPWMPWEEARALPRTPGGRGPLPLRSPAG